MNGYEILDLTYVLRMMNGDGLPENYSGRRIMISNDEIYVSHNENPNTAINENNLERKADD